jgi:hypothetical protein
MYTTWRPAILEFDYSDGIGITSDNVFRLRGTV